MDNDDEKMLFEKFGRAVFEKEKLAEKVDFWIGVSKRKDVKISELEDRNSELQTIVSGLNEFIAKEKAGVGPCE